MLYHILTQDITIIKPSVLRIIKAGSFSIWGSIFGLFFLLFIFMEDYSINKQIDGFDIVILIFTGYMILIWMPVTIFYINYFMHSGIKTYTIDLDKKSINYFQGKSYKKIEFREISELIKVEHINNKKEIKNPANYWDRLENSLEKNQRTMTWSKFSYIKISGKNGEVINDKL